MPRRKNPFLFYREYEKKGRKTKKLPDPVPSQLIQVEHGECKTALHMIWKNIVSNKKTRVQPEWSNYILFRNWALDSGYQIGDSIRRKNSLLGYNEKNCYWIPQKGAITAFGETKSINAWARDERCSVSPMTILRRLRKGTDPEIAITYLNKAFIKKRRKRGRRAPKLLGLRSLWKEIFAESHGWGNFKEFHFWLVEQGYKPGKRVVRHDKWKRWSPLNCKIVDRHEAFFYECLGGWSQYLWKAWGESKTITEWLQDKRCRCNCREILEERLRRGWNVKYALTLHTFWKRRVKKSYLLIDGNGVEKTVEWWIRSKRRCKVSAKTFLERLRKGVPLEEALGQSRLSKERDVIPEEQDDDDLEEVEAIEELKEL